MKRKLCTLLLGLCLITVSACGEKAASGSSNDIPVSSQNEKTAEREETEERNETEEQNETKTSTEEESSEPVSEEVEHEDASSNEELVDGMRPEFKEAMDSYEDFFDQYCDTIKKYNENPSDLTLLADYTDILAKSAEASEKFKAWESDGLNDAELKYFIEVESRVAQKLLEVSQ